MEENAQALNEALAHLRTGAVAQAARDDVQGRFGRGEAVGFVADEVVAWGEPEATLRAVLEALADGAELISVLAGRDAPLRARGDRRPPERRGRARAARWRSARLLVAAGRGVM